MSLAHLLDKTFDLYRWTKGSTYPYTNTGTWAKVISSQPCYVSNSRMQTVNEDKSIVIMDVTRFRTMPYAFVKGDRIYYKGHIYGDLKYEDIDELGRESVTIGAKMNDSTITDMGIS